MDHERFVLAFDPKLQNFAIVFQKLFLERNSSVQYSRVQSVVSLRFEALEDNSLVVVLVDIEIFTLLSSDLFIKIAGEWITADEENPPGANGDELADSEVERIQEGLLVRPKDFLALEEWSLEYARVPLSGLDDRDGVVFNEETDFQMADSIGLKSAVVHLFSEKTMELQHRSVHDLLNLGSLVIEVRIINGILEVHEVGFLSGGVHVVAAEV